MMHAYTLCGHSNCRSPIKQDPIIVLVLSRYFECCTEPILADPTENPRSHAAGLATNASANRHTSARVPPHITKIALPDFACESQLLSRPKPHHKSALSFRLCRADHHLLSQHQRHSSFSIIMSLDQLHTLPIAEQEAILDGPALRPPPGVVSHLDDPPNNNGLAIGVTTACLALGTCFALVRAYSRLFCVKRLFVEDCMVMNPLILMIY